jgi:hypothetical protein
MHCDGFIQADIIFEHFEIHVLSQFDIDSNFPIMQPSSYPGRIKDRSPVQNSESNTLAKGIIEEIVKSPQFNARARRYATANLRSFMC